MDHTASVVVAKGDDIHTDFEVVHKLGGSGAAGDAAEVAEG